MLRSPDNNLEKIMQSLISLKGDKFDRRTTLKYIVDRWLYVAFEISFKKALPASCFLSTYTGEREMTAISDTAGPMVWRLDWQADD